MLCSVTTLVPTDHPAHGATVQTRVDYMKAAAAIAFADGDVSQSELDRVREFASDLAIPEDAIAGILEYTSAATDSTALIEQFSRTEYSVALLVDAADIACADGRVDRTEAAELERVAKLLGLDAGQLYMVRRFVEERRGIRKS